MRRLMLLGTLCCVFSHGAFAQDTPDQTAILAERRDFEERHKRLVAEIEDLKDAYRALQKRSSDMATEISRLRDENLEHTRALNKYATREDLRAIVEKIQEVDSKRESDRKLILDQLERLATSAVANAAAAESRPSRSSRNDPPPPAFDPDQEFYSYTVQKGNTLSDIVKAYNDEFKRQGKKTITTEQVLQANPKLKPDLLYVGREIQIPVPK